MSDSRDIESRGVPAELAELDEELASIRVEERPSFGPELEAQLTREWLNVRTRRRPPVSRWAVAAVAGVVMVGVAVPQARASLARLVTVFRSRDVAASNRAVPPAASPFRSLDPSSGLTHEQPASFGPAVSVEPPPAPGRDGSALEGPKATVPELVDVEAERARILDAYPVELQRAGVGGTVGLLLWIDSLGAVDFASLRQGSGVPELDSTALRLAHDFTFRPASRWGRAVGMGVELDVVFRPPEARAEPEPLPHVPPVREPEVPEPLSLEVPPEWTGTPTLPAPGVGEASDLLQTALGDDRVVHRLGSIDAILRGEAPAGVVPTRWRAAVGDALERARVHDPDNPAPLLALARIRRSQGLGTEVRVLLEQGLTRARRMPNVAPGLLADLHYERGILVKQAWLGRRDVGRVRGQALPTELCPEARSAGGAESGFASTRRLTAWNYLCPEPFDSIMKRAFEPVTQGPDVDRQVMLASFRSALAALPSHRQANVEMLLALADEGRWNEMLAGARKFLWASRGHPYGLLLAGLALQRMSRTEQARDQFTLALRGLSEDERSRLEDVEPLLTRAQRQDLAKLDAPSRAAWVKLFWKVQDPILATDVNERWVEHVARATYAYLRFDGVETDAGGIWLRYGRPRAVRVVRGRGGLRTEFWDYGSGPDITLRRVASSDHMDLTPEGRTYVDELLEVFPQRYGSASRPVYSLPGQWGRFRGSRRGITDVEVYTSVPELLATGAEDTLNLGVFLLASDGEKVAATERRIAALEAPVSLEAPAASDVVSVVVELYDRRGGRAASLRAPVRHEQETESGLGWGSVSDLLLTKAVPPRTSSRVRRGAPWIEPLTLGGPVRDDAVGVLFEVYDIPGSVDWYRVRAEVVDRDSEKIQAIPVRLVGKTGFRPTWDRILRGVGSRTEYVTARLTGVPAGHYALRVVVDLPGAPAPLTASRNLDRS